MSPEQKARQSIDEKLAAAGWLIQDFRKINLSAGPGVAVREYPTDTGPADYVLFVDREAVGVIEAKRDEAGENLTAHEGQTERYAHAALKWRVQAAPLPFLFESTGQIVRFTDGRDPAPRSREIFQFFKQEQLPVIRMGNIQDGDLDLQDLKYLPVDHDEFPVLFLDDGDLLFNRTNSPELVGKTAVFRSQVVPCSYASYLIAVRFSPSFIPDIAATYINSGFGRQWIKSVVTQQVGQANVNGTKLAALAIPLPPLDEQAEIVRLLLEQQKASAEQGINVEVSLKQSAAQRKNILKAAFSGQLVSQDSNDEPASALLERIRAERANAGARPKVLRRRAVHA